MNKLEDDTEAADVLRKDHTLVVDGLAYVRQIKTSDLTYQEFSAKLLRHIINSGKCVSRIDAVFDVYKENSVKDVEHARRSNGQLVLKQIVPSSPIKQWS